MKKILLLLAIFFLAVGVKAQVALDELNLENKFQLPLKAVFDEIERRWDVKLVYPENLVKGRVVTYALFRFEPDFETTLNHILQNQDMEAVQNPDGTYRVRMFEYAKASIEVGIKRIDYLYSLYDNLAAWEKRREQLKTCITEVIGIPALRPHLKLTYLATPVRKMDGYTVQNFSIETLPGVYATGSVYRPAKVKRGEKLPFILNPNGHFPNGRYYPDIQTICAMQARMGAVAVSLDLFAYGESLLAFKSEDHRNSMAMRMQALNNTAVLDYFLAQSDIDLAHVAITGASGGGSQSMTMAAMDDRIKFSAPMVMVSSYFVGGCGCESGLPIALCGDGTNLAEIAALTAPRPMLIVSDGKDWTDHVDQVEYPFIKRTYGFYGKENLVTNVHLPDEGHDMGPSKRFAVYDFMVRELGLNAAAGQDAAGEWDESRVTVETEQALRAFGPNGENFPKDAVKGIDDLYTLVNSYLK